MNIKLSETAQQQFNELSAGERERCLLEIEQAIERHWTDDPEQEA